MKRKMLPFCGLAILVLTASSPPEIGVMQFPEGTVQHVVRASEIPWQACPPSLPEGCEMFVLEGDPKAADLFTVRFKSAEGFSMPAHTHPKDERVTILAGTVRVGFGMDAKKETATVFGPGDYYVNKRGEVHKVWAEGGSILQITGIGPWEANFVASKD